MPVDLLLNGDVDTVDLLEPLALRPLHCSFSRLRLHSLASMSPHQLAATFPAGPTQLQLALGVEPVSLAAVCLAA